MAQFKDEASSFSGNLQSLTKLSNHYIRLRRSGKDSRTCQSGRADAQSCSTGNGFNRQTENMQEPDGDKYVTLKTIMLEACDRSEHGYLVDSFKGLEMAATELLS